MRPPSTFASLIWPLALFILPVAAIAAECSAKSGAQTVPLLELYTSEGCSSCPPADKWLSGIESSDKLVPLAFHVDYWDYIGWKDRYAKADFSERQRQAALTARSDTVYTPQVIFNGSDFRGWHNGSSLTQSIAAAQKQPARASLSLNLTPLVSGEIRVQASAQSVQVADRKNADVFIAVYENNLKSVVNAGENSGRVLNHDYVVREWFGPYHLDDNGASQQNITLKSEWKGRNAGVATFVQNRRNGEILQALSLPFCS
jgi:hypothetical protein